MLRRWVSVLAIAASGLLIGACGGDDADSTPTPSGGGTVETPNTELGPAEAFVIFGSSDATREILGQLLDAGAPPKFFLGDASRNDSSFDGLDLPGDALVQGATNIEIASEAFDAAYQEAYGRAPVGLPGVREAYDAVYLAALAAAAANSTDTSLVRDHLTYVANSPGELATPGAEGFAAAFEVLAAGGDVNYIGASGQVDLTASGDMSKGQLEVWRRFGGNVITQEIRDVDLAAEIRADVPAGELVAAAEPPSGPLKVGALVSLSGGGEDLGGAISDAIEMAVAEINLGGGLFGADIEVLIADDGSEASQATTAAQDLVGQGVSAIIGPITDDIAAAVAADVTGPAPVLQIALSGAAALTSQSQAFLIRTRAAQSLQAPLLANLALEAEADLVCVLYEDNAEHKAMAEAFRAAFEYKEGGVRVVMAAGDDADVAACVGN